MSALSFLRLAFGFLDQENFRDQWSLFCLWVEKHGVQGGWQRRDVGVVEIHETSHLRISMSSILYPYIRITACTLLSKTLCLYVSASEEPCQGRKRGIKSDYGGNQMSVITDQDARCHVRGTIRPVLLAQLTQSAASDYQT